MGAHALRIGELSLVDLVPHRDRRVAPRAAANGKQCGTYRDGQDHRLPQPAAAVLTHLASCGITGMTAPAPA